MHAVSTRSRASTATRVGWRPVAAVAALLLVGVVVIAVIVVAGRDASTSPAVQRLEVDFDGLRYVPDELVVRPGGVRVALHNGDAITHTFTIESLGVDVELGAGESASVAFDAGFGSHQVICTIPGHLEGGMTAQLRVK